MGDDILQTEEGGLCIPDQPMIHSWDYVSIKRKNSRDSMHIISGRMIDIECAGPDTFKALCWTLRGRRERDRLTNTETQRQRQRQREERELQYVLPLWISSF